jgi:hypothetical protein
MSLICIYSTNVSDPSVLDVNSIDPKQLNRMRQQRIREQKQRELERYLKFIINDVLLIISISLGIFEH